MELREARDEAESQPLLHIIEVPGNHGSSLPTAIEQYFKLVEADH